MARPRTVSATVVRTLAQLMYQGSPGSVRGQATLIVSKMIHTEARYVTGAPHRPRVNGPGRGHAERDVKPDDVEVDQDAVELRAGHEDEHDRDDCGQRDGVDR